MVRNKKQTIIDLVIIFIVSLIPIIWLYGGYVILGHDAGTPITPDAHFLDRLTTWTHRYGLGDNQTFAVPGFFLHGLEYILSFLPVSLSVQQIISFVIYFQLMGISMYLFARALFSKFQYLPLFAAIFYQVNHFVLQAWFVAERTKFTTYILLPLIFLYQFHFLFKKKQPFWAATFTALSVWIFNGGGFVPLFGAILILQPVFLLFLILQSEEKGSFIKQFIVYIILAGVFSLGLNSYWLLPYYSYISSSFGGELVKAGGVDGVITWVSSISLHTSLLNEFRLQGIQEWYVNPFHPYSQYYLQNPLMILASFLIPIAAFGSLFFKKKKSEQMLLLLFGFMALVSMVFMAGSHPPFGDIYIQMIKKVPGFIAFRTPFYKFAPGLWLCYAILIGYTIEMILTKIKIYALFLKGLIVLLIVGYTFPILSPTFFDYYEDRTTRVQIPEYVHSYADWSNSEDFNYRRLLVMPPINPETNAHVTDWGYWSLASAHSLLDRNSYVHNGSSYLSIESKLINKLYSAFENNDPNWKTIANVLNIDGIILLQDVKPFTKGKEITPNLYKSLIEADNTIQKEQQFGKWTVYNISKTKGPFKLSPSYYHFLDLRSVESDPIFDAPVDLSDSVYLTSASKTTKSLRKGIISTANCVHCTLIDAPFPKGSTDIRVLPGSRLFEWKLQEEQSKREELKDPALLIPFELEHSWKRSNEIERLIVSNADSDKKALAWRYYSIQHDNLSDAIKKIKNEPFSSTKNELLVLAFNTIKLQNSMLLDRIKDITGNITEGSNYIESMKKSNQILSQLSTMIHYSTDITEKKMIVTIPSDGTYDVYMKNELDVDTFDEPLLLKLPQSTHAVYLQNSPWIPLATEEFESGEYPYSLSIPLEIQNVTPLTSKKFNFTIEESCQELPLGVLQTGTYSLQAEGIAQNKIVVALFINNDSSTNPLLPYWGNTYTLSNDPLSIKEPFVVKNTENITLHLCIYEKVKNQSVTFDSITIYNIANPTLIFIKDELNVPIDSKRNVTVKNQSQSSYDIVISPGVEHILTLDQRYNALWEISIPNSEHLLVNNYANGWLIPASDTSIEATVSFKPESELKLGWRITVGTLIAMLFSVGATIIFVKR